MSVDDFIDLCKAKIHLYLDDEYSYDSEEYDTYIIWKDYWTIGATQDNTKSLDNQRAIFGVTTETPIYFDISYNGDEEKLYMKVFTNTDTETYQISNNTSEPQ